MISKYDYKLKRYKRYYPKWKCSFNQKDNEVINCAICGKNTIRAFTSETILDTKTGRPYLICKECLEREIYERRDSDKE